MEHRRLDDKQSAAAATRSSDNETASVPSSGEQSQHRLTVDGSERAKTNRSDGRCDAEASGSCELDTGSREVCCDAVGADSSNDDSAAGACGGSATGAKPFVVAGVNLENLSPEELEAVIAEQRAKYARVKTEHEQFVRQMELAEAEVNRAAAQLCSAVDNRVNELLATASSLRADRVSQFDQARTDAALTVRSLHSYQLLAEQLLQHGTPAEVTHYAPLLHEATQRMASQALPEVPQMTSDAAEKMAALQAFANLDVGQMAQQAGGNLLGHVTRSERVDTTCTDGLSLYLSEPSLIATVPAGNAVVGVAVLDTELFAVRERSSVVEVFDMSAGLTASRQIDVEQMTCPSAIAVCTAASCLFVTDSQICGVFRVACTGDAAVTVIPVEGVPSSVSLSAADHLVLTVTDRQVIRLVSQTDGSVVRELPVTPLGRPVAVLPVNGDHSNGFVVCVATDDGLSWLLCGHELDGMAKSLEHPFHLRSLRNVCALVPDPLGSYVGVSTLENSVCLFDSTFSLQRPLLTLTQSAGVDEPVSLALHPTNGRLVVGQRDGVIKMFQLLRTRDTIEIGVLNWPRVP